jgi:hypothetical protein
MSLSFSEVWRDAGVDDGSTKYPAAMMVPATGANLVMLKGAGAQLRFAPDTHFTVKEISTGNKAAIQTAKREVPELAMRSKSEDAAGLFALIPFFGDVIADAFAAQLPGRKLDDALARAKSSAARLLLVEGKRRGQGTLTVKSDSNEASMKVWVRDARSVSVSFHFVQDIGPDGKSRQRSSWNPAAAGQWIARLNDIYTPQTNISFTLLSAAPFPVNQRLPDRLALTQWLSLGIKPKVSAVVNIFLVGTWIGDKNDPLGSFIKTTKDIVVDDRTTQDEIVTVMAHEIGHLLGASVNFGHPEPADKSFLMTTLDWRQGAHIPQEYAQHFNPI